MKNSILATVHLFDKDTPSSEENKKLIERVQAGDKSASDELVRRNGFLVLSIIERYYPKYADNEDVLQEGWIGLFNAAQKFDLSMDTEFSTYATYHIRARINRYLSDNVWNIHLPPYQVTKLLKIGKAEREIRDVEDGHNPTNEEISEYTDIPVREVEELRPYLQPAMYLDAPINDDDGDSDLSFGDTIAAAGFDIQEGAELDAFNKTLKEILNQIWRTDSVRQRNIEIFLRANGLCEYRGRAEQQIALAREYGVSAERVRTIINATFRKMKHPKYKRLLKDFLKD